MRLIFAGTFPVWLAAALAVLCLAFTWWVYRRQALLKPWAVLLPTARSLALLLLLLALRQPVLSRIQRVDARGRLPVIVDTSGSMSIIDSYTPAEKVQTAWHLALFARDLRTTVFVDARPRLERLSRDADTLANSLESWAQQLAADPPNRDLDPREPRQLARQAADLLTTARLLQTTLDEAVAGTPYLAADHPGAVPDGRLTYERYTNLPGWELDTLLAAPDYPDSPTASALLGEFRAPANVDEHYGARLRGWLQPPASGKYVFAIAADDQAALYLSDDDNPANQRRIAFVPTWVEAEEYDRHPQQRSAEILLDKGRTYYVEAMFKENLGDDHCSVAWWRPDGREENPIPGVYFSAIGRTVEQRRFTGEMAAVAAELSRAVAATATLAERLESLPDSLGTADGAARLLAARQAGRPAADAWQALLDPLADLQRWADQALAGAGVEGVDTALRKLARMSRLDLCQHLLLKGPLKLERLERSGVVELFGLHEPLRPLPPAKLATGLPSPDLPYTRLGSAIQEVVAFYGQQPISAILLLSDGNSNSGRPLGEVGQMLKERQIPLFAVGIGLPTPPADISLETVLAPNSSFRGDRLNLSAVVRRHGYTHRPITLQVKSGNEVLVEKILPPGPAAITTVDLSFVENHDGFRHYLVEAETMTGEVLDNNNRRTVSVNILADPVRALLIDQFPRWESRYAKMMFERDPRLQLTTRFLDMEGQQRPPPPPPTREELFVHDILMLGDVDPERFGGAWLDDLRAFVVERGGCLVLMAGPAFMPQAYRETALADILPLRIQPQPLLPGLPATVPANPAATVGPLKLTEAGRYANLVQIGPAPDLSARLWETLPPLNWRHDGVFPAANAEVLVVAGHDQAPIMLTAYAGLGKILYLGSDSFWRWRYRSRWTFHHRLWGQILLWATLGRTTGTDEHIKLMTDRPEYSPGETVTLQARIFDRNKMPLEDGTVSADLRLASGPVVRSVKFTALANSGGEYRAQVRDLPAGRYLATPRVVELAGLATDADYPFEIRDLPTSEFIELALDEAALRTLTREYRHLFAAADLPASLPRLQQVEEHRQDVEIWDSPWLLALVALLLGGEWQMRKKLNRV